MHYRILALLPLLFLGASCASTGAVGAPQQVARKIVSALEQGDESQANQLFDRAEREEAYADRMYPALWSAAEGRYEKGSNSSALSILRFMRTRYPEAPGVTEAHIHALFVERATLEGPDEELGKEMRSAVAELREVRSEGISPYVELAAAQAAIDLGRPDEAREAYTRFRANWPAGGPAEVEAYAQDIGRWLEMERRDAMRPTVLLFASLAVVMSSCASTRGSSAEQESRCNELVQNEASGAPTIELLADAVGLRSERRIDHDAMRVVVRAPRHVSMGPENSALAPREAALSHLLRSELTAVLAERWKLIDDPQAATPLVTHELQADFGEVAGDVALSLRLVDVSSSWIVATARSVVPMEEIPFLAALPSSELPPLEFVPEELAEPTLEPSPQDAVPMDSGEFVEQLASDTPPADGQDLTSQALTDGQLRELVGPAARRLGPLNRLPPR